MDINSDAIVATLDQATETLRLARERITQLEALVWKYSSADGGFGTFTPADIELVSSIRRGAGLEAR
jgi:hypothetical protein